MKNYIFMKWVAPKVRPLWPSLVNVDKEFVDAVNKAPRKVRKTFVFFAKIGFLSELWQEYQNRRNRRMLGVFDDEDLEDILVRSETLRTAGK